MARLASRRWAGNFGAGREPVTDEEREAQVKRDQRRMDKLSGPVTTRKATPEELARLRGRGRKGKEE